MADRLIKSPDFTVAERTFLLHLLEYWIKYEVESTQGASNIILKKIQSSPYGG